MLLLALLALVTFYFVCYCSVSGHRYFDLILMPSFFVPPCCILKSNSSWGLLKFCEDIRRPEEDMLGEFEQR